MVRRRVVVRGSVQGVGYRWAARDRATALGVSGFVQNRPDGSVFAEVDGEPGAVDAMVEWMRSGPPGARVTALETSDIESDGAPDALGDESMGFAIRR
ncbi:acylphosphatase [Herbiconiux sp. UC225_62]|uniref:acylphosphatase n=1 Tax=Herbiconiux sp. UC225_62 TaxID=3350168 RepID=UPI0036D411A7